MMQTVKGIFICILLSLALFPQQADCSLWTWLFGESLDSTLNKHGTEDETDDTSTGDKIFQPENRPKTYSVVIDRLHPKVFEMNQTQKIVEFSEYNETTKSFVTKNIVGNISTQVFRINPNLSSFVLNDRVVSNKRHHVYTVDEDGSLRGKTSTQPPTSIKTKYSTTSPPPTPMPSSTQLRVVKEGQGQQAHNIHEKGISNEKGISTSATLYVDTFAPVRKFPSTIPVPHQAHDHYEKHIHEALKVSDSGSSKLVFIGDSIFSQLSRDSSVRDALISYHPLNLASPGFRTEHMLYRLTTSINIHKAFSAKVFVVMIGTFNIGIHHSPDETKEGVLAIVNTLRKSISKSSRIVVCSILPRQSVSLNKNIDEANSLIKNFVRVTDRVHFLYLDPLFKDKSYPKKLQNERYFMPDHLHPSEEGYHAIIRCLKPFLIKYDLVNPLSVNITRASSFDPFV